MLPRPPGLMASNLGLDEAASAQDVRQAYLESVKAYHPDLVSHTADNAAWSAETAVQIGPDTLPASEQNPQLFTATVTLAALSLAVGDWVRLWLARDATDAANDTFANDVGRYSATIEAVGSAHAIKSFPSQDCRPFGSPWKTSLAARVGLTAERQRLPRRL